MYADQATLSQLIADVTADQILEDATNGLFGVILQDIEPIDQVYLASRVLAGAKELKVPVQLCLPGADAGGLVTRAANLSAREEDAVDWRNKKLRTIAILANAPLLRAASFREFKLRDDTDLVRRVVRERVESGTTQFLANFWKALDNHRAERIGISLPALLEFRARLDSLDNDQDRSLAIKDLLPLLGLCRDPKIAEENKPDAIAKRLKRNKQLVEEARLADDDARARMLQFERGLPPGSKERTQVRQARLVLTKLAQGQTAEVLEGLEFEASEKVWRGVREGKSKTSPDGGKTKVVMKPVEEIALKALLEGNERALSDLREATDQVLTTAEESDEPGGPRSLTMVPGEATPMLNVDDRVLRVIRALTSEQHWGGSLTLTQGDVYAIDDVNSWSHHRPIRFEGDGGLNDYFTKFVEAGIFPSTLSLLSEQLHDARALLLPKLRDLTFSPVVALTAPKLFAAANDYLKAYENILLLIASHIGEALNASPDVTEELLSLLARLEVYLIREADGVSAILSPLHPLHLWRPVQIVKEARERGNDLNELEIKALEEALARNVHFLNTLFVPKHEGSPDTLDLGLAGSLGPLPLYRRQPRTSEAEHGVKTVGVLAEMLATIRPYVRSGLRVMLVNPPKPQLLVETLLDLVDTTEEGLAEDLAGMFVRIRYTEKDALSWLGGLEELSEQAQEVLDLGLQTGMLSLDASDALFKPEQLERELEQMPAHLTVVFDPYHVRQGVIKREGHNVLNPWVLNCKYTYDRLSKQVNIVPVADSSVFGTYLRLVGLIDNRLNDRLVTYRVNQQEVTPHLERLAAHSTWFTIAELYGTVPRKLGPSVCIDIRNEGSRVVSTYTDDLVPYEKLLDRELTKTFFRASKETLAKVVRDMIDLEPRGILALTRAQKEGDQSVKGALGKIIALRSYRYHNNPSGLAVSLDTTSARHWLVAGKRSRVQADLLGLQETPERAGELMIDVLEVKAYDSAAPFTVGPDGLIRGDTVDQVMATFIALAEMFGQTAGPGDVLKKPRLEVLKEHLFQACLRDSEEAFKQTWYELLNRLFEGSLTIKLRAQIVRVRLGSVEPSQSLAYESPYGIPIICRTISADDVGLMLNERPRKAGTIALPLVPDSGLHASEVEAGLEPDQALELLARRGYYAQQDEATDHGALTGVEPETGDATDKATDVVADLPLPSTLTSKVKSASGEPEVLAIELGAGRRNSEPLQWVPSKLSNGFFLILGASGSGKTETLKVLGAEVNAYGIPVLIFDFHGDIVVPGTRTITLSHGPASTIGINPMELESKNPIDGGPFSQRNHLRDLLKSCVPSIQHRQWKVLGDAFQDVYRACGIVDDDPATWENPCPTFQDVVERLEEMKDEEEYKKQRSSIDGALDAVLRIFEHPVFSRREQLSLEQLLSSSHRLNLAHLEDGVRFIVTDTLLRKLFRTLKAQGPIPVSPKGDRERYRLFVVIDEAKILTMGGKDRNSSSAIINILATEARKFGVGMVLATQRSFHFGDDVRANAATWLALRPENSKEAKENAPDVHVEPHDLSALRGHGDGILRMGSAAPQRIQVLPMSARQYLNTSGEVDG
jgi:hypothetical protein